MTWFRLARLCAVMVVLCLCVSSCVPAGDSQLDEQKEPHYLKGRNLASAMDYPGAIEAFEQALEVNPHSASAHWELGCLYEKEGDNAAAIYHYERFLKSSLKSDQSDLAKSHINFCKIELAKTVSSLGPPAAAQHDLERLVQENRDLTAQLAQWQAYYAATRTQSVANPATEHPEPVTNPASRQARGPDNARSTSGLPGPSTTPSNSRTTAAVAARTHTVKQGESPSSIARKYGISISALLSANPQIQPTHLHPGQILNIPAS